MEPGLFSQQMALPWQADFFDCRDGPMPDGNTAMQYAWWPSQRPITVNKGGTTVRWDRGITGMRDLAQRWPTRGFVVDNGSGGFDEQGGPP